MFIAKRTTLKSEGRRSKVEGRKKAEFRVPKSDAEGGSSFGFRPSASGFDPRVVVAINMALLAELGPTASLKRPVGGLGEREWHWTALFNRKERN